MTIGQRIMATSAGFEAATGLLLLIAPSVLARLLIGSDIDGPAIIIANIAGLALISLGIACWPRVGAATRGTFVALLIYNLTVALLLAEAGASSTASGLLLWPAVLVHVILTAGTALTVGGHLRSAKALP